MMECSSMRGVCDIFRHYTRIIHKKSTPSDPNFLAISVACGKIEQFIESIFPTGGKTTAEAKLEAERAATGQPMTAEERSEMYWTYAAIVGLWLVILAVMSSLAWMLGARFDLVFAHIKEVMTGIVNGTSFGPKQVVERTPAGRVEL
jgi:farnesyl-diphosphate farnesyltransferase